MDEPLGHKCGRAAGIQNTVALCAINGRSVRKSLTFSGGVQKYSLAWILAARKFLGEFDRVDLLFNRIQKFLQIEALVWRAFPATTSLDAFWPYLLFVYFRQDLSATTPV